MTIIECKKLCKTFKKGSKAEVRALTDVSLVISPGSFSVLTGTSGSGKTTLLGLLGALERPSAGQVLFQARELSDLSDVELTRVRRHFGFVFQDFALIPDLTVWENITYPLIPRGIPPRLRRQIAHSLLTRFRLAGKFWMRAKELSAGEQQRVALARALVGDPEVLLADEPTSNLDAESAKMLAAIFQELHAAGKTVVVASHDPLVIGQASQVFELQAGRLQSCELH